MSNGDKNTKHKFNWTKIAVAIITAIIAPLLLASISSLFDKIAWAKDVETTIRELKAQTKSISETLEESIDKITKQLKDNAKNTKLNKLTVQRMNFDFSSKSANSSMLDLEIKFGEWKDMSPRVKRVYLKLQTDKAKSDAEIVKIDNKISNIE